MCNTWLNKQSVQSSFNEIPTQTQKRLSGAKLKGKKEGRAAAGGAWTTQGKMWGDTWGYLMHPADLEWGDWGVD